MLLLYFWVISLEPTTNFWVKVNNFHSFDENGRLAVKCICLALTSIVIYRVLSIEQLMTIPFFLLHAMFKFAMIYHKKEFIT